MNDHVLFIVLTIVEPRILAAAITLLKWYIKSYLLKQEVIWFWTVEAEVVHHTILHLKLSMHL